MCSVHINLEDSQGDQLDDFKYLSDATTSQASFTLGGLYCTIKNDTIQAIAPKTPERIILIEW